MHQPTRQPQSKRRMAAPCGGNHALELGPSKPKAADVQQHTRQDARGRQLSCHPIHTQAKPMCWAFFLLLSCHRGTHTAITCMYKPHL